MNEITIREAKIEDMSSVQNLLNELTDVLDYSSEVSHSLIQKNLIFMKNNPDIYRNFIAEINDLIVGFLSMILYRTFLHQGGTALINELVVSSGYRNQGIGKKLLEKAKSEARIHHMDEIEVGLKITNHVARKLYSGFGFNKEYILLGMDL